MVSISAACSIGACYPAIATPAAAVTTPERGTAPSASKLPGLTPAFWAMKICATTLGETGGDLFSMTMGLGYAATSSALVGLLAVALAAQMLTRRYMPALY